MEIYPTHARTPRPVQEKIARLTRRNAGTIEARFWAKVNRSDARTCWEWTAYRRRSGYGELDHIAAHRLSYYLSTGEDPGTYFVCHRCDNPPCVNPSHLYLGTPRENQNEMWLKGRGRGWKITIPEEQVREMQRMRRSGDSTTKIGKALGVSQAHVARILRGEFRASEVTPTPYNPAFSSGLQKLTDEQVLEIRRIYARGGISQRALASQFGISQGYICHLIRGDWKGRPRVSGKSR